LNWGKAAASGIPGNPPPEPISAIFTSGPIFSAIFLMFWAADNESKMCLVTSSSWSLVFVKL
jgi:hypothetical protein